MDTIIEVQPLTRDDIAALKIGDSLSFHHYQGQGSIRVTLRSDSGGEPRIFTSAQQRLLPTPNEWERKREIAVDSSVSGYDDMTGWRGDNSSVGFSMSHGGYVYDDRVRTIVDLLRPADRLHLKFVGDGYSNGVTKPAGIHVDHLTLIVKREGKRDMHLLMHVSACLDNSARMVKR